MLMSCAVTAQLICIFVFPYADRWFAGGAFHLLISSLSAIQRWCREGFEVPRTVSDGEQTEARDNADN